MARDRKRAKQRQRQRRSRQQPARAREERQGEPARAPEAGEGTIATPGPLKESSAEVEIAEQAERAIETMDGPATPLKEEEYPQRDELEGADALEAEEEEAEAEQEAPARERRGAAAAGAELPREGNRFANFLRACVAELRRVQWPDRRQVGQATGVVLGFVLIAGGYLGILDAIFSRLVNAIL
jgi:preprotein translocase subunit SecE